MPICTGLSRRTWVKKTTLPVMKVPLPTAITADWNAIALGSPGGGNNLDVVKRFPVIAPITSASDRGSQTRSFASVR
jgi:hypothetical protein